MSAYNSDFNALAQGAEYCAQYGGSFVLYVDGKADDSFDTLDDAATAYADCWGEWGSLEVVEFAPSGRFADVTAEARTLVEKWCHSRREDAPWESDDGGMSEHDHQRREAVMAGHFA